MTIRKKLTLQFTAIVATIILFAFLVILFLSAQYRESEFESRLEDRAIQTARLFIEIDEVDSTLLIKIDDRKSASLIDENVTIMSNEGKVLYTDDSDNRLRITDNEIAGLNEDTIVKYENGETEVIGLHYISAETPYYIFVGGYDKYGKRKIRNLQFTLLTTWIICVLVMAYAGWLFSGRALKPVSKIILEVDQINERNLESRINEGNGKDELARLANTFNSLLNRLESSIRIEKTFLANASHELRNPLAAITSQLEVCLLNQRNSDEYINTMQSVLEDISALNVLSHQLLLLARIDAGFVNTQYTIERIDQLIFDACENSTKPKNDFRIDYRFLEDSQEDVKWELNCSKELVLSAFQNIVDNARKFDATQLIIEHKWLKGFHHVTFIDNGIGIDVSDQSKIFEPFFRSKNSKEKDGHGIGLSLVKRVVEFHNGTIQLSSNPERGISFTIVLPKE